MLSENVNETRCYALKKRMFKHKNAYTKKDMWIDQIVSQNKNLANNEYDKQAFFKCHTNNYVYVHTLTFPFLTINTVELDYTKLFIVVYLASTSAAVSQIVVV